MGKSKKALLHGWLPMFNCSVKIRRCLFTLKNSAGSKLAQSEKEQIEKEVTRKLIFALETYRFDHFSFYFKKILTKRYFCLIKDITKLFYSKDNDIY